MNDHVLMVAFLILRDGAPLNICDKTFKAKYHHNLAWDRHFKSRVRTQQ